MDDHLTMQGKCPSGAHMRSVAGIKIAPKDKQRIIMRQNNYRWWRHKYPRHISKELPSTFAGKLDFIRAWLNMYLSKFCIAFAGIWVVGNNIIAAAISFETQGLCNWAWLAVDRRPIPFLRKSEYIPPSAHDPADNLRNYNWLLLP